MTRNYLRYGFYPPHVCRKKPLDDIFMLSLNIFMLTYYILVKQYTDNINISTFTSGLHAKKHDKGT